jgi:hypothetical protein
VEAPLQSLVTKNGTSVDFELSEVAYVPSSRCILLSLLMLANKAQLHERASRSHLQMPRLYCEAGTLSTSIE